MAPRAKPLPRLVDVTLIDRWGGDLVIPVPASVVESGAARGRPSGIRACYLVARAAVALFPCRELALLHLKILAEAIARLDWTPFLSVQNSRHWMIRTALSVAEHSHRILYGPDNYRRSRDARLRQIYRDARRDLEEAIAVVESTRGHLSAEREAVEDRTRPITFAEVQNLLSPTDPDGLTGKAFQFVEVLRRHAASSQEGQPGISGPEIVLRAYGRPLQSDDATVLRRLRSRRLHDGMWIRYVAGRPGLYRLERK